MRSVFVKHKPYKVNNLRNKKLLYFYQRLRDFKVSRAVQRQVRGYCCPCTGKIFLSVERPKLSHVSLLISSSMYRVLVSFHKTRLFILVFALKFEVGTKNYENSSEMESRFISLQCLGNYHREILTRLEH